MTGNERRTRVVVELASALAVVATLVFVGLEVRETRRQTALNTEAIQVAAYQDLISQINRFNELLLEPDVAAVFERMQDPEGEWSTFSPVERRQARSLLYILVRHADMAYYQFEHGMLPEERFDSALRPLLTDMDKPIYRAFWEEVKGSRVPGFRDYIDRRIAQELR